MFTKTEEHINIVIPNRLETVKWLYPICESLLNEMPISDKRRHMILVALSEGFTNAYQHGNQKKPDAEIRLTFYPGEKSLKILIEDDAILPIDKSINEQKGPVDPEVVSGRGLQLMRELVDEAFYVHDSRGVNILTLISNFANNNKRVHTF